MYCVLSISYINISFLMKFNKKNNKKVMFYNLSNNFQVIFAIIGNCCNT